MVFSSPIFLFAFLPAVIAAVLVAPKKTANIILLAASLVFYAWGEGRLLILMLLSIILNYAVGLAIGRAASAAAAKTAVSVGIAINIAMLAFFKYANFGVDNINAALLAAGLRPLTLNKIHLPIGISFFTFQAMSYIIDVYRKETRAQKNPLNIALYISLFPQLVAGPIVRYHDIAGQILSRIMNIEKAASGVRRFILGLGKKVLVANTAAFVADGIFAVRASELNTPLAWLGAAAYTFQIYFDFSGYSDMAIGLGKIFGFDFPENFNYPYISRSIQEFWRRWHISLSTWFRDYLYIPLGGNRMGTARTYANLLTVFFLTGLWHGASWSFVVWGLYHGAFLAAERAGLGKILSKIHPVARHAYVMSAVVVGWVLFRAESLAYALVFIKNMAGFSSAPTALHHPGIYMSKDFLILAAVGAVASAPIYSGIKKFVAKFADGNRLRTLAVFTADAAFLITVLGLSALTLSSGTYNPFIYYRF